MRRIDTQIGDHYELSTGRTFYANNGIIGIDEDLEVFEGYDGGIDVAGQSFDDTPDNPWTPEERAELADAMIARWQSFKGSKA